MESVTSHPDLLRILAPIVCTPKPLLPQVPKRDRYHGKVKSYLVMSGRSGRMSHSRVDGGRLAQSTLLRDLNAGKYGDAVQQLLLWIIREARKSKGLRNKEGLSLLSARVE